MVLSQTQPPAFFFFTASFVVQDSLNKTLKTGKRETDFSDLNRTVNISTNALIDCCATGRKLCYHVSVATKKLLSGRLDELKQNTL